MSVLIVADTNGNKICPQTYELITAAAMFDGPVAVALLGGHADALAAELNVAGVDSIITVPLAQPEFESDSWRDAVIALIQARAPVVTLMSFTVNATAVGAAVAATLGLGFAADVIAMQIETAGLSVVRPLHGGKVHAELDFPDSGQQLLLLRPGVWPASEGAGNAVVESFAFDGTRRRVRHLDFQASESDDADLSNAEFILCIGRGIGDGKAVARFEQLAEKLGATLAASRPVVDRGWLPRARQVGQSGITVQPRLYLALGVSGAPQHLAGMQASALIIAVNADPAAPIFDIAHYGAVADLFDVATQLERLL